MLPPAHDTPRSQEPGFNPHPTRGLDATAQAHLLALAARLSILIQPEGWMLRASVTREGQAMLVSILIQPEGWMLPLGGRWQPSGPTGFNPHPTRRLDATLTSQAPVGPEVLPSSPRTTPRHPR